MAGATPVALLRASLEYNPREEDRFRRELEIAMAAVVFEIENIKSCTETVTSLASKRENLLSIPVGIKVYS